MVTHARRGMRLHAVTAAATAATAAAATALVMVREATRQQLKKRAFLSVAAHSLTSYLSSSSPDANLAPLSSLITSSQAKPVSPQGHPLLSHWQFCPQWQQMN
jgi:hypothetical protein